MTQKQKRKHTKDYRKFLVIKVGVFFATLIVFAVIGLLIPLRPSTSTIEKRTLATFPKFTVETFLDGTYFSDIDTWYADTYPLREQLLAANAAIDDLHGLNADTFIAGDSEMKGDEIPTGEDADAGDLVAADVSATAEAAESETPAETVAPTEEADEDSAPITEGEPEIFGNVYVTQGRAFDLFYFVTDYFNRYCKALNTFQAKVGDDVTVYDMPVPVNSGIILSTEMQEELGTSDQGDATEYLFANLDSRIKTVGVYDTLRKHNDEYIYFRTDHHWTQLGAYYAYEVFAEVKGITAHSLDSFETCVSEGFLGSFYSASQSEELRQNADTVTSYIPNGTNEITGVAKDGTSFTGEVVADGEGYDASALYLTYIKGDQPYSEIHNPEITDGSTVLVVKESYGNCFVPFLVDHYQNIYIIDYRYYSGDIYTLVEEKGVQEVLFINYMSAISSDTHLGHMETLVNQ